MLSGINAEPLKVVISGALVSGKGTQCEIITKKVEFFFFFFSVNLHIVIYFLLLLVLLIQDFACVLMVVDVWVLFELLT